MQRSFRKYSEMSKKSTFCRVHDNIKEREYQKNLNFILGNKSLL